MDFLKPAAPHPSRPSEMLFFECARTVPDRPICSSVRLLLPHETPFCSAAAKHQSAAHGEPNCRLPETEKREGAMASAAYQPSGLSSQQQNARSPATTSDWASGREATATGVAPVCGSAEALSGLGDRRAGEEHLCPDAA